MDMQADNARDNEMMDAVLFDLDGVIRHYPEKHTFLIEEQYSLPPGSIHRAAFAPDLILKATTGILSRRQWIAAVSEAIGCSDAATAWDTVPAEIDADVLAILSEIKSHEVPVYLLTNGTDNLRAELRHHCLTALFDGIFNSAELGVAKPAPEIFQRVIHDIKCLPHRIAYTDDAEMNIAAAKTLRINSLRYTGSSELRRRLSGLRVIG